jgi:CRP/FNR family cyclic AMP-dependent transcriptional regulator
MEGLVKSAKRPFDPKAFLAKVGTGKTIVKYRKGRIIYAQGEEADKLFYIQSGKVKVTVVSEQARKLSSACWKQGSFSARDVCMGRRSVSGPPGRWRSALLLR